MTTAKTTVQRKQISYAFDKLSDEAKQTVLESMRTWYEDERWWDDCYGDFENICDEIGVEVDAKKIFFTMEDGVKFTSRIKLQKLIAGIVEKKYLKVMPYLHEQYKSFTPERCTVDPRVLDLIERGWIDVTIETDTSRRCYSSHCRMRWNYDYNECVNYNNIEAQMTDLESWVTDIVSELDHLLERMLDREYSDRSSNAYLIESIKEQGFLFNKAGERV
jgi:hypothetical protein